MAYVRYYTPSLRCMVDDFLFSKYLKGTGQGTTKITKKNSRLSPDPVKKTIREIEARDGGPF